MDAICVHPFDGQIITVPVEMIGTYVPYALDLKLEAAARMAIARDVDESINFVLSVIDPDDVSEGVIPDHLASELPSIR